MTNKSDNTNEINDISFMVFNATEMTGNGVSRAQISYICRFHAANLVTATEKLIDYPWCDSAQTYLIKEHHGDGVYIPHFFHGAPPIEKEVKHDNLDIEDTLPETISGLLLCAINDLEEVEQIDGMAIDMDTWSDKDACTVCLAGSVLVKTFGLKLKILTNIAVRDYLPHRIMTKLLIIDSLRDGNISIAIDKAIEIGMKPSNEKLETIPKMKILRFEANNSSYSYGSEKFIQDIRHLVSDLERLGY